NSSPVSSPRQPALRDGYRYLCRASRLGRSIRRRRLRRPRRAVAPVLFGRSQWVAAPLRRRRLFQKLGESLSWRSPSQGFTGPSVELVVNAAELGLGHMSQGSTFGKVVAEKAVRVRV